LQELWCFVIIYDSILIITAYDYGEIEFIQSVFLFSRHNPQIAITCKCNNLIINILADEHK
ncbi:hypothetical protein B5F96_18160, partial [Parabacteroides johnsonii]